MTEERKPKKRPTEAKIEEMRKAFRAKLKKYYEGHFRIYDDDDAEDTSLLSLAEERKGVALSEKIAQAKTDAESGVIKISHSLDGFSARYADADLSELRSIRNRLLSKIWEYENQDDSLSDTQFAEALEMKMELSMLNKLIQMKRG